MGGAELLGALEEGGGGAADEVVMTGATEDEGGGGAKDDEETGVSDVDGTNTELEDGTAPTLFAAEDVGWMSTELDTRALDVGTALLLSRLEVGLPALQRLTWRFRGTTEGTATGAEDVSGEASLAATAWRRWCTLRAMC